MWVNPVRTESRWFNRNAYTRPLVGDLLSSFVPIRVGDRDEAFLNLLGLSDWFTVMVLGPGDPKILITITSVSLYEKVGALPSAKKTQAEDAIREKIHLAESIVSKLRMSRENKTTAFRVVLEYLLRQEISLGQLQLSKPLVSPTKGKAREALTDRISTLVSEGFFKEPKPANEVQDELKNRGAYHSFASVGMALLALVRNRTLRRVPVEKAGKKQYLYTNP